jgi:hypothetical protein
MERRAMSVPERADSSSLQHTLYGAKSQFEYGPESAYGLASSWTFTQAALSSRERLSGIWIWIWT